MNVSTVHPTLLKGTPSNMGERSDELQTKTSVTTLCLNCSAALDSLSVRCLSCGHRHRMTSCDCCGEPTFKHASTCVIKKSWRGLPSQGPIFQRVWRWIQAPSNKQILYLHPVCAKENPEFLTGACSVTEAEEKFFQSVAVNEKKFPLAQKPHGSPLKLVGGTDLSQQTHKFSSEYSEHHPLEAKPSPDDIFLAYFDEEPSQLPEIFATYHSGERDFSETQLPGLSMDGAHLLGIDLSRANLRRATWKNVNLSDADFSGAIADYSRFDNIDFTRGLFRNSSFRDVKVILSDLTQADFYKADLRHSDFYSSNFHRATLTLANLMQAKLDATDLSQACLLLARLSQASLMEANLAEATLEQADLNSANLSWANLTETVAPQVNLSNATLQKANLAGIDLSEAQLLGTDFLSSNLDAAQSLQGATYNDLTRFPPGFYPQAKGMIKVENSSLPA